MFYFLFYSHSSSTYTEIIQRTKASEKAHQANKKEKKVEYFSTFQEKEKVYKFSRYFLLFALCYFFYARVGYAFKSQENLKKISCVTHVFVVFSLN